MSTVLRTQFLNYMTLQRFSKDTKRHYVMAVNGLAKFYNQSPDKLTNDQQFPLPVERPNISVT